MKVSFDFDSTLTEAPIQELVKKFLDLEAEVFVVTTRATEILGGKKLNNEDVFELTDKLGIKRGNIIFTEHEKKYKFVKEMDMHFDDAFEEIFLINQFPGKCIGFLYEDKPENGVINY